MQEKVAIREIKYQVEKNRTKLKKRKKRNDQIFIFIKVSTGIQMRATFY